MRRFICKSICIIALVSPLAIFAETVQVTQDFDAFSRTIQASLSKNWNASVANTNQLLMRDLVIGQFCQTMESIGSSSTTPAYKNTVDGIYYNPKHSIFVHVLCDGFGYHDTFLTRSTSTEKTYFFKDDRTSLGIYGQGDNDNDCNPSFSMNDCDISTVFTSIMQRILNDMFDIKQATVYGSVYLSGDNIVTKINESTKQNFVGLELCPDNKCNYPKTKNRIQAYFKRGESLLKKLDIINQPYIKNIADSKQMEGNDIDCSYPRKQSSNGDEKYHIFICGFGTKDLNGLNSFALMINNEMFFYRLFMAQYMGWIQSERRILPSGYTSSEKYVDKTTEIIAKTQQQIARTQDASTLSMKMLREMYATFPIHIGLLIYYEDLYRLRKELVKVVTPLYTLYDKLRNVQKKDD